MQPQPINIQQALNYRFNDANVAKAKQMGWTDDQINAYKQQAFQDLSKQNAMAQAMADKQAQQAQTQDKGNFLSHLLPSGGSIAGGLGGAAAGAALGSVVPVVGTGIGALLGGILGGAGGGALGKVGENAVEGNSDLGQGVGQEALTGGLTSLPVGAALKLGQAGFKAVTGIGKTGIGDLLAQAGGKTIPKAMPGLAQDAAQAGTQNVGQTIANAGSAATQDGMGQTLNPGILQKLGGALENAGTNQLVKNQVNLTRAGAAKINGGDVPGLFKTMQSNYGLSNLNDMNQVGALVTGKAGLDNGGAAITNAVEQAVMSGKGINADDLKTLLQGRIDQAGAAIKPSDIATLQNQVAQAQKSMYDQTAAKGIGSGPTSLVDPLAALQQARALGGNASTFLERNPNVITSRDQALGGIYSGLSNDIKDRLFNSQGALGKVGAPITADAQGAVNEAVTSLRGEAQKYLDAGNKTLGNAINKVADQAASAKTISDLNALQSPFVNASKLKDVNGLVGGGAAGNVGGIQDTATGMLNGAAGEILHPAMNGLAAGTSKLGSLISSLGQDGAASAAGQAGGQTVRGAIGRNIVERGVAGTVGAANSAANNVDIPPEVAASQAAAGGAPGQPGQGADAAGSDAQTQADPMAGFGATPDQVRQAMVQAVKSGNTKAVSDLSTLYNAMQKTQSQAQASSKLSPLQQKNQLADKQSMTYLNSMEQNLAAAGGAQGPLAGNLANVPLVGTLLSPKGEAFNSTRNDIATALARSMTGGKPTQGEIIQWLKSVPSTADTPAQVQYKLQFLRNSLTNKMAADKNSGGGGNDLASQLQNMMAN